VRKTSKQLKEERGAIDGKIAELSKLEARTDAQNTELTGLFESRESLTIAIETELRLEKHEAEQAATEARKAGANGGNFDPKEGEKREYAKFSLTKTINEIAAHKEGRGNGLSGLEKELVTESEKEARTIGASGQGVYLSNDIINSIYAEKRAMVAGTPTAGGNFIPTEKVGFFEALFAATVLNELGVQSLTGLSANTDMIGFTGSVTAAWASSEVGTQTPTDATTAARELRPKLLYAACDISRRLMIQTNDSIDRFIMQNMVQAMAVEFERAVINGAGSTEPTGLLTQITQTIALGAAGSAPTYPKILELIQTVLSSDGRNVNRRFLVNPKVVSKLKNTTIDSGSGAFIMGYNGLFQSQMGVIDGYGVSVTANVPSNLAKSTTTGGLSAMIFGDFSQIVTGQFGGVELIVDPYTKARTGQISLTMNSFMDSTVLQPNALGDIVDMVTT
jgi:HK97 family phage major capsid protein